MIRRLALVSALTVAAGCSTFHKTGKISQYVSPSVDATRIKRISLIGDGRDRANAQIISRARTRLTQAGVPLVVRSGSWETNELAIKSICEQRPQARDNVDGVAFVGWDHLTLHDCASQSIAIDITGTYAGIDGLVDKLIAYLGVPAAGGK